MKSLDNFHDKDNYYKIFLLLLLFVKIQLIGFGKIILNNVESNRYSNFFQLFSIIFLSNFCLLLIFTIESIFFNKKILIRVLSRLISRIANHTKICFIIVFVINSIVSIFLLLIVSLSRYNFLILEVSIFITGIFCSFILLNSVDIKIHIFSLSAENQSLITSAIISLLSQSVILEIGSLMTSVSSYPFSMDWSEGSFIYYASLFFSQKIYGIEVPWTVLHPSRYLLQSIPFIFPHPPIYLLRLWQQLLYIAFSFITSWSLVRRVKIQYRIIKWVFIGWLFLYFFIGPIYFHLYLSVFPLFLWFETSCSSKKWRSFIILIFVSVWAGISRVNWFPVPSMIAILLYILEVPNYKQSIRYWIYPVFWFVTGLISAYIANSIYIQISGNPKDLFFSSFTSSLLWYRLLPNSTFPLGILLSSGIIWIPMILVINKFLNKNLWKINFQRKIITIAILIILYVVGLIVSVKIGGGNNLHNLDAFWICLSIVFIYTINNRISLDHESYEENLNTDKALMYLSIGTILIPIIFIFTNLKPIVFSNINENYKVIHDLQVLLQKIPKDQEILFISERQLITFGNITGVRLVPEYEKVFLMEMAMANNQEYLKKFTKDIINQRFAVIISEPLYIVMKDRSEPLAEENNVWVENVAQPILCAYKIMPGTKIKFIKTNIQIFMPRDTVLPGCQK